MTKPNRYPFLLAVATVVVAVMAAQPTRADVDLAAGKAYAQNACGRCHAVGPTGASPVDKAPAFRRLHELYPVDSLAEALAEGIVTGHEGMPEFQLEADEIENLLGYIKSISR